MKIQAFQSPWELQQFVDLVSRMPHRRILEVGAMYGGTLWQWMELADRVVVVDDEMREAERWHGWATAAEVRLELVQGDSRDPQVVREVASMGPYDLAFIDADHTYEAVRADWDNYGGLAKVVAFHDILPRPGYGVSRLWQELTSAAGACYVEICQNETLPGNEGPCGIGVLWT